MAAINDLIRQISDPQLRDRIQKEVDKIAKQKKFGLVFEEHLPEGTRLYDMKVKKGDVTYSFKKGTTTDYRFQLEKGENILIISGNGSIEFRFRIGVL